MKILKYLLFLVLLIVIGSAIYFGTKEGNYHIEDSMVIKAPPEVVFNQVNDYKNWEKWGPWIKEDSTLVFTYAEKTSGEGASYSWEGEMSGSMTTTKVIPNKEIEQDLSLKTPAGERNPKVTWHFEEVENGTKVTWGMKGEHTLLDKVYYSLSDFDFESSIHQMNQQGLKGLAQEAAADMAKYTINVDGVTQYGGGYYMYTTSVAKTNELREKKEPMMQLVTDFISDNNLNKAGAPFILFNEIDEANGTIIFSTCVPVKEKVITPVGSPVVCGFMEPVSAVKTTLKGDYKYLPEAYMRGKEYMAAHGLQVDGTAKIFEVYVTGPDETLNPAAWITEIYMPIVSQPQPLEDGL